MYIYIYKPLAQAIGSSHELKPLAQAIGSRHCAKKYSYWLKTPLRQIGVATATQGHTNLS